MVLAKVSELEKFTGYVELFHVFFRCQPRTSPLVILKVIAQVSHTSMRVVGHLVAQRLDEIVIFTEVCYLLLQVIYGAI
jgi:hypothetical protein